MKQAKLPICLDAGRPGTMLNLLRCNVAGKYVDTGAIHVLRNILNCLGTCVT